MRNFRRALVSVSDKTGLVEFLKPMVDKGLQVVSTGGTLKTLKAAGIAAIDISEQTGFPEVMHGRVKTLHPRVHMALLARGTFEDGLIPEDAELMQKSELEPFDLVVVNLYPFAEAQARGLKGEELIEFIDIGGPSMLRAAAKNMSRVAVVTDPADYTWIQKQNYQVSREDRTRLAIKVFGLTSLYDSMIARALAADLVEKESSEPPLGWVSDLVTLAPVQSLRYGENPQQAATWYRDPLMKSGLHAAEILHGKPLSYNNVLDLDAAVRSTLQFNGPAAVAVKHNSPCGLAIGETLFAAAERALRADPVSVFGGIIALNRSVDITTAQKLTSLFLECVIAPDFSAEALAVLKTKKDLRVLKLNFDNLKSGSYSQKELRSVLGGYLLQSQDQVRTWSQEWQVLGRELTAQERQDAELAWIAAASLKSNAIAIAAGGTTLGLGMGQTNRVDAVEQALLRMKTHHPEIKNAVLASDAFFPFADSIQKIADAGLRIVVQPGGSIRDSEVKEAAKSRDVTLVLTQRRHFRH